MTTGQALLIVYGVLAFLAVIVSTLKGEGTANAILTGIGLILLGILHAVAIIADRLGNNPRQR
jgi:hypothetical protein